MSQPSISQHVAKLKSADIVKERRQGQWIFYRVNKAADAFALIENIVTHLPDQKKRIQALEVKGLRVCCD